MLCERVCCDVGKPCIFPFTFKMMKYMECIKFENNDVYWCSTEVDKKGNYVDGEWGNCTWISKDGTKCTVELDNGGKLENVPVSEANWPPPSSAPNEIIFANGKVLCKTLRAIIVEEWSPCDHV